LSTILTGLLFLAFLLIFTGLLFLAFLLIFIVVLSTPESYTSYYEEIYTRDQDAKTGWFLETLLKNLEERFVQFVFVWKKGEILFKMLKNISRAL